MSGILETPHSRRREDFLAAVRRSRSLHGHWTNPPSTVSAFDHYPGQLSTARNIGFWVLANNGDLAGGAVRRTRYRAR